MVILPKQVNQVTFIRFFNPAICVWNDSFDQEAFFERRRTLLFDVGWHELVSMNADNAILLFCMLIECFRDNSQPDCIFVKSIAFGAIPFLKRVIEIIYIIEI